MNYNLRRAAWGTGLALGGVAGAAAGSWQLIMAQANSARRRVQAVTPLLGPTNPDGVYGEYSGPPIGLSILGDSSAVGLGVDLSGEAPGPLIASGLAELAARPVLMNSYAFIGAESKHLDTQIDLALHDRPDLAVLMIGANDVTTRTRPSVSVRYLSAAVTRLREAGVEVVVATCPDLGTLRPVGRPLRWIVRGWSRQLAALQTVAVVRAGGRTVSLGAILGPTFARDVRMFSADQFHPSAEGYAAAAAVILPSAASALGLWPDTARRADRVFGKERIISVEHAALRAAGRAGTEVSRASAEDSPHGGWARLRRRRPMDVSDGDGDPALAGRAGDR